MEKISADKYLMYSPDLAIMVSDDTVSSCLDHFYHMIYDVLSNDTPWEELNKLVKNLPTTGNLPEVPEKSFRYMITFDEEILLKR